MIWILYVVVGFVGLVVLCNLVGLALPRDHIAARRAFFAKPPDRVWDAMVELSEQVAARENMPIEVERDERPRDRVTRILDDKLPFGGRWYYEVEPKGSGALLTITEAGFVK